jgi:hypothetical protein
VNLRRLLREFGHFPSAAGRLEQAYRGLQPRQADLRELIACELSPGGYPSLASMDLNDRVSSVRAVSTDARIEDPRYAPAPVGAQVTFYENEGLRGRSFTTQEQAINFERSGFNTVPLQSKCSARAEKFAKTLSSDVGAWSVTTSGCKKPFVATDQSNL